MSFEGLKGRRQEYNATFKQADFRKHKLGVALCNYWLKLAIVYMENYYDNTGIDFSLRLTIIETTYFTALFTINTKAVWRKFHIKYMVSSRE